MVPSMLRAFANLPRRQVHYRHGGSGEATLVMLHASPGCGRQMEGPGTALCAHRSVVAPDRPGNGDSPRLPIEGPEIADYARAELELLDGLGIENCDVYGMHTGACVAVELAILAPTRIRRVVLDGLGLFPAAQAAQFLARYAPAVTPDPAGAHLTWAFNFIRNQALFFPWYDARPENARGLGLPGASAMHESVLDLLKSIETYHLGYRASFRYDPARLRLVAQKTLAITAEDDPLFEYLAPALRLLPNAVARPVPSLRAPDRAAGLARVIDAFLAAAE